VHELKPNLNYHAFCMKNSGPLASLVVLAVFDQGFEGSEEVFHTTRKTWPADSVQTEVCHTGRGPECSVLPRGRLVATATYLRFATVSVDRQGDLSSLRFGIS
jgi:hypothetical protein